MEGRDSKVRDTFTGTVIYRVPFYQRKYVWNENNWERFLSDMEFVCENKKDYFIGSVILKESQNGFVIVDGQQRFTTLTVFLKALCEKVEKMKTYENEMMKWDDIQEKRIPCIIHSRTDRKDYEYAICKTNAELGEMTGIKSGIIGAYNYFYNHIDTSKLDYKCIQEHLIFVKITLNENDDEQIIFDTINSLGTRLTTGELLKNYFFNEADESLYNDTWVPMFENEHAEYWDKVIGNRSNKKSNIEYFFSSYLKIKIEDPELGLSQKEKDEYRRDDGLFSNYRKLIEKYRLSKKDVLSEILEYSKLYKDYLDYSGDSLGWKPSINRINFLINELDCTTMIPYILYVLHEVGDEVERNKIWEFVETYIVRRIICKIDSNGLNKLFTENLINSECTTYVGLKDCIERKERYSSNAMPNNNDVRNSIKECQRTNSVGKCILYLLESKLWYEFDKKISTPLYRFSEYSLEHLMPKKWHTNWILPNDMDSEYRDSKINTLGNMSLLTHSLNSSISNKHWKEKLPEIKKYKGSLITLEDVVKCDVWNEDEIEKRSNWLTDKVLSVWVVDTIYDENDYLDDNTFCENITTTNHKTKTGNKKVSICFPDNSFICENNVKNTLIKFVDKIGVDKIYEAQNKIEGQKLLRKEVDNKYKENEQEPLGDFYLFTCNNTDVKVEYIKKISEILNLGCVVKID